MKQGLPFYKGEESKYGIISENKPQDWDRSKKITLQRGISKEEYDEVYEYLRDNNLMNGANCISLLPKNQLAKLVDMGLYSVLMRRQTEKKEIIGTILSLPINILCNYISKQCELTHGYTTFLNVHPKLRKLSMCSNLIKELCNFGFEKGIYCSYFLNSFKLLETSIKINTWYRPINLVNCLAMGFPYKDYTDISKINETRIKYKCKTPANLEIERITSKTYTDTYNFYKQKTLNKKFVFLPNFEDFKKWIKEYSGYYVIDKTTKSIIGVFSIYSLFFRTMMGLDGIVASPLMFLCEEGRNSEVFKCLLAISKEKNYDLFYFYEIGDLTEECYNDNLSQKVNEEKYFSLYNNAISLEPKDISVPLF